MFLSEEITLLASIQDWIPSIEIIVHSTYLYRNTIEKHKFLLFHKRFPNMRRGI